MSDLKLKIRRQGFRLEDVEGVERPTIEISATDYYPVLAFIARHIAKVDGLENGGKAVVWRELSQELQRTVLRRLHPFEAFDLLETHTFLYRCSPGPWFPQRNLVLGVPGSFLSFRLDD